MSNWLIDFNLDKEPQPDIAHCSNCGGDFHVSECPQEKDGDWESGYYMVHVCPVCEDGGCIDDYSMSDKQADEWCKWKEKQND